MISPGCHQPYIATVANACGCTQGPFWLPWRIILVALGNCPGWPGEFQGSRIEAIQNLPDVHFFFLPLLTYASKTRIQRVSAERSMKFGNIVRVETLRYLTKITMLRR